MNFSHCITRFLTGIESIELRFYDFNLIRISSNRNFRDSFAGDFVSRRRIRYVRLEINFTRARNVVSRARVNANGFFPINLKIGFRQLIVACTMQFSVPNLERLLVLRSYTVSRYCPLLPWQKQFPSPFVRTCI